MKHFIRDYALNVIIAILLISLYGYVSEEIRRLYYTHAPLESFYERGDFIAFDICVGDENQSILSTRVVKGTEVGFPSQVNKELFRVSGSTKEKVFEETTYPFVDVASNGAVQRIQRVPIWLKEGDYQWVLYVNLDINSVAREVIPPLESNIFKIKQCYG